MCRVTDCSASLMAAAKDEPEHDVIEQDEPSSTGTECALCNLNAPAITEEMLRSKRRRYSVLSSVLSGLLRAASCGMIDMHV